jgi:hypothetical protein
MASEWMANTGDLHGEEPWEGKSEEDEDKREVERPHERRKCLRKAGQDLCRGSKI